MKQQDNTHTPGPWHAVAYPRSKAWRVTISPENAMGDIANVICCSRVNSGIEKANARLIAAAPCLLEALESALPFLEQFAVPGPHVMPEIQNARAAIAKAKGGAS